jgi:hypothetical protein
MVNYAADASDESARMLGSIETQIRTSVTSELRKQSKILSSIESRLAKLSFDAGYKAIAGELAFMAKSQTEMAQGIDRRLDAQNLAMGAMKAGQDAYHSLSFDQNQEQTGILKGILGAQLSAKESLVAIERKDERPIVKTLTEWLASEFKETKAFQSAAIGQLRSILEATKSKGEGWGELTLSELIEHGATLKNILGEIGLMRKAAEDSKGKDLSQGLNSVIDDTKAIRVFLESIESKLQAQTDAFKSAFQGKSNEEMAKKRISAKDASKFTKAFGALADEITNLLDVVDAAGQSGENVKKFLVSIADGVVEFSEKVDPKKMSEVRSMLISFSKFALVWGIMFSAAIPSLALSVRGATLFSTAISAMMEGLKAVEQDKVESARQVVSLGNLAALFGASLTLFFLTGKESIAGAQMFVSALETLTKGLQDARDPKAIEYAEQVVALAHRSVMFGVTLSLYNKVSKGAVSGVNAYANSLDLLMSVIQEGKDPKGIEYAERIIKLAHKAVLFGAALAIYNKVAKESSSGAEQFGSALKKLIESVQNGKDPKSIEHAERAIELANHAISFGLRMSILNRMGSSVSSGTELYVKTLSMLVDGLSSAKDPGSLKAAETALGLANRSLAFGMSMVVFAAIGKAASLGSDMFVRSLNSLLDGLSEAKDPKVIEHAERLVALGRSSLLFGLSLAAFAVISPLALIGALTFTLSIKALILSLDSVDKDKVDNIKNLMTLTRGILWFAASLAITSLVWDKVLLGALVFSGTIMLLGLALDFLDGRDINKGIGSLYKLSLGIVALGLGMLAFYVLAPPEVALQVILSVGAMALTFAVVGEFSEDIGQGAIAMALVAGSLLFVTISMLIFKATGLGMEDGFNIAVTVGLLALPFMLAGIEPIAEWIVDGAITLAIAAVALSAISIGLLIFKASEFTVDDGHTLAATIGGMGLVFALVGIPVVAIAIILGSIALAVAGISLGIISLGMAAFKAVDFDESDGERLKVALGSMVYGFLGGEPEGGLLSSLAFAGKLAARTALLFLAVPPMIMAAGALALISTGLMNFKKANFGQSDADAMEYSIGSLVKAFSIVVDKKRQQELGIDIDPISMWLAVKSLSDIGSVVFELGRGIQSIANLEIVEYEVQNGKLVAKSVRKLNDSDFNKAGENISKILSALAIPLAQIGMLEKEGSSGNALFDSIFSNGYISTGIRAISDLGETIANLGRGIKDFANLQIVEYGVKNGKLVPIKSTLMTDTDFVTASMNIGRVTGFLAMEFAKIGKMEDDSSGWFSDGYVTNGVEAIAGMGENLSELAKAVVAMARMEVVEHTIKDGKLVPSKVIAVGNEQLSAASTNIGLILGFLATEFAKIGRMEDEGSGWFSDGMVTKGRDAIVGMGKDISSVVDAIVKIATSEFTTFAVVNGQLVPTATRKLNANDLKAASQTIGMVLNVFAANIAAVGSYMENKEDQIKIATKYLPKISELLSASADSLNKWAQIPDPKARVLSLTEFLNSTKSVFDSEKDKNLGLKLEYFGMFSKHMETLASSSTGLDAAAKSLERVEKSMKAIKESVNGMDLKKLTTTDSLVKSLAIMSKSPEATAKAIKESIEDAFEKFIESLKDVTGDIKGDSSSGPTIIQTQAPAPAAAAQQQSNAIMMAQTQANQARMDMSKMMERFKEEIIDGLSSVEMKVRVVNNNFG